jgi:peptide/nickel transport system permease protein
MLRYSIRRLLTMIPTLIAISVIVFVIIQLPPGDYLESHIATMQAQG